MELVAGLGIADSEGINLEGPIAAEDTRLMMNISRIHEHTEKLILMVYKIRCIRQGASFFLFL